MLPDVVARKVAQMYVALTLSTEYCKCRGCDNKKNIGRYAVQNLSFNKKTEIC